MEAAGFIQKGEQVSIEEVDDMLRQYVEPIEVDVFHYNAPVDCSGWRPGRWTTRWRRSRWPASSICRRTWPSRLRVIASIIGDLLPAGRPRAGESDCHATGSGFHRRSGLSASDFAARRSMRTASESRTRRRRPADVMRRPGDHAAFFRGRPRGRLRATMVPRSRISPPQTPHGSCRSSAAARHSLTDRAIRAQRLGLLQIDWALGEPQIGIPDVARHRRQPLLACQRRDAHLRSGHRNGHVLIPLLPGRSLSAICLFDGSATRFLGVENDSQKIGHGSVLTAGPWPFGW